MTDDAMYLANARMAEPEPGFYDVVAHGDEHMLYATAAPGAAGISPREVARMLAHDPAYRGEPIRLIACSTGACGSTAAQNLSNAMGVEVLAPDDLVWAFPGGKLTVAPAISSVAAYPDMRFLRRFRSFAPGKPK